MERAASQFYIRIMLDRHQFFPLTKGVVLRSVIQAIEWLMH